MLPIGIAWGARPASKGGDQHVGDVLVAHKAVEAGHGKVKDCELSFRGAVTAKPIANSVNAMLCRGWPRESQTHFGEIDMPERRPKVHVGTVLSLPTLIDDEHTATALINHPQIKEYKPIDGDMELYQVVAAADEHGKRWLFSKGISDYGGLAGAKNKEAQPLAAAAAVDFADWVLRQPVMDAHLQ